MLSFTGDPRVAGIIAGICPKPRHQFASALTAAAILLAGCTRPPWPTTADDATRVVARLNDRKEAITSATYRVRWRARGTEPHGEFVLDIAYKAPARFRVSASGPLGIPAFTAVVIGEEFWFVDHPNQRLTTDSVQNFGDYELPLAEFFTGLWRDLFSGGWGGESCARRLHPSPRRGWYEGGGEDCRIAVRWNEKNGTPSACEVRNRSDGSETTARIDYRRTGPVPPGWELTRLRLEGFPGGGAHTWILLSQKYNPDIPDRLFLPLDHPGENAP